MKTIDLKEIVLSENEREIFDLLLCAFSNLHPKTQLRVVGGWVRDKLIGQDSNDIDIAIENMSASKFLDMLNDYLRLKGKEEVQGHIIESKPEQHKQLETLKMRFCNQWIDVVNLKSVKEDAYRRDLTINSLFYNINTGLVEDFTKRGIDDLKSGRIVTPLSAKTTFMEDPLRVLRAIRFSARYGFTLDEELKEAALREEEVRVALAGNVSRERIGNEIDLMITGNRPVSAVTYLFDLKLFSLLFALPSSSSVPEPGCGLAYMEAMWNLIQTHGLVNLSGQQTRLALYAALFLPFRKMVYKDTNKKQAPVVSYIFKVSMKRKRIDADTVVNIHKAVERFLRLILPLQMKNDDELQLDDPKHWECITRNDSEVPATSKLRVATGLLLKDIKELWRVALLTSLLLLSKDNDGDFQLDKKRNIYLTVQETIIELGLDGIWDVKPLVNGHDIIKALKPDNKRRVTIIREWQSKLLTWQLAYPNGMPLRHKKQRLCEF
ncbi:hypothetical protein V5N11_027686 [Cardamine amara subsp. amara]|uniref:Poly A polymerase head domain-containing protein n=1 Tax=Cardamine amara subsp. amara TaxID=228776 RepID=A0ABD0ZYT0_CARAN